MAAVPFPKRADLIKRILKAHKLISGISDYKSGNIDRALMDFWNVFSWYVLGLSKWSTVPGLGTTLGYSTAAAKFEIEWQGKINRSNQLASQLAALVLRQATLDRFADSLPLVDPLNAKIAVQEPQAVKRKIQDQNQSRVMRSDRDQNYWFSVRLRTEEEGVATQARLGAGQSASPGCRLPAK